MPITQREAFDFIEQHHRHHQPPVGSIFQVALARDHRLMAKPLLQVVPKEPVDANKEA